MTRIHLPVRFCVLALCLFLPALACGQDMEAGRPAAQEAVSSLLGVLEDSSKIKLGLAGATEQNTTLGPPMAAYTIRRTDFVQSHRRAWGGLFGETDLAFFPIRVAGQDQSAVWLERTEEGWRVLSVGEREFARALATAKRQIAPALAEMNLHDPYELRLLVLDWAASRLLAVLIRDRLLMWPLPSAAKLIKVKPGLYPAEELRPLLLGQSSG